MWVFLVNGGKLISWDQITEDLESRQRNLVCIFLSKITAVKISECDDWGGGLGKAVNWQCGEWVRVGRADFLCRWAVSDDFVPTLEVERTGERESAGMMLCENGCVINTQRQCCIWHPANLELNWVEKSTGLGVRKSEITSLLMVLWLVIFNFFELHLYNACLICLREVSFRRSN